VAHSRDVCLHGHPSTRIPFHSQSALLRRNSTAGNNSKTYLGLQVQSMIFRANLDLVVRFSWKSPISNFIEIRQVEAVLMHTDGHDEGNRRSSRL
jgi:hypothetical protein